VIAEDLQLRAASHAALGDIHRLAIVDELALSDRSPHELRRMLGLESNLVAHHLAVLERAGLIRRSRSSGDKRRRYVQLDHRALAALSIGPRLTPQPALFVCSANSARSQLAAALWRSLAGVSAESAGTRPADKVHPGAVDAARRHGLTLHATNPRHIAEVRRPRLVVTVCDHAHEELDGADGVLHWSITDPVQVGSRRAFDASIEQLSERITRLVVP
jgi:protein-tyrosine-phosphatase